MRDEDRLERERALQSRLQRLSRVLMLGFVAVVLALIYWSVIRAPTIVAREDNPRLVVQELRIQRGRILDRRGEILAETIGDPDQLRRFYPVEGSNPGVGYYSFRHGTAGIEEGFDSQLRGENAGGWALLWRQLLHQPQIGRDVQMSLNGSLQEDAAALLKSETGAVLLMSLSGAEILAMASYPAYDPNQLDENFEALTGDEDAPLLNRATQGLYQPGLILQPFVLAAALDKQLIDLDQQISDAGAPVPVNGGETTCASPPPETAAWSDVVASRCPAPMAELGETLGASALDTAFAAFGLTTAPELPISTETADSEPVTDARLAAIGQESLTVTPLQLALAWMAIGLDGRIPIPRLVRALEDETGAWQELEVEQAFRGKSVSPSSAVAIREILPRDGERIWFSALVLSGPQGSQHAWYLGLAPAEAPRVAVVVVLENSVSTVKAEAIGRTLLELASAADD